MTERRERHSMASGVSGVTESTPSGPFSLLLGPPAVRASFNLCDMLPLELRVDDLDARATERG